MTTTPEQQDGEFEIPTIYNNNELLAFEEKREQKTEELKDALEFLQSGDHGLLMHKGVKYDNPVEYFRGIDFNIRVLKNKEAIKKLVPTLLADKDLGELETLEDSIKLGQLMIYVELISKLNKHPNYIVQKGSSDEKFPKFLADDLPIFSFDGFYAVSVTEDNSSQQRFYLTVAVVIVLFMIFFNFWPVWLQQVYWNFFYYVFILYVGVAALKFVLKLFSYHMGADLILFPSFNDSMVNPLKKFKWPFIKFEWREDALNPFLGMFRIISLAGIIFLATAFVKNESVIEELREIQTGFGEIFDMGYDLLIGNELSGGDNSTESFKQKLKKEMEKATEEEDEGEAADSTDMAGE